MVTEDQQRIIAVIDFETLSTKQDAAVLSLAITWFKVDETVNIPKLKCQTRYWNFDSTGQEERDIERSTLIWWTEQSKEARQAYKTEPRYSPKEVLQELRRFCKTHKIEYLIGNGIGFDNALLKNLCEEFKVDYPIEYWGDLDLRTLKWLTGSKKSDFPQELTPHIAAHDCIYEAMEFQRMFKELNTR